MEKILGIIGGMGPAATIQFYKNITDKTPAKKDQEHIRMIILNHTTIPDRTEAIEKGDHKAMQDIFLKDAKYLEDGGASAIAIACNTFHLFVEPVEKEVGIPVINMIRETAKEAKSFFKAGRVGILATKGTIKMELYQNALKAQGLEPYVPSDEAQESLMNIIYRDIKSGKKGSTTEFAIVEKELEEAGCVGALIACTELSIYMEQENLGDFYIDAMSVLEDRVIEFMKG